MSAENGNVISTMMDRIVGLEAENKRLRELVGKAFDAGVGPDCGVTSGKEIRARKKRFLLANGLEATK